MSGTIASCGGISQLPSEDHSESQLNKNASTDSASSSQQTHQQQALVPHRQIRSSSSSSSSLYQPQLPYSSSNNTASVKGKSVANNNNNNSALISKSQSQSSMDQVVAGVTTASAAQPQQRTGGQPAPERPPRKQKKLHSNNTANSTTNSSNHPHAPPQSHRSHKSNGDHSYDHHTLATATTASATISYSTDQGDASVASEMGMEVVMAVQSREDEETQHQHISHHDDHRNPEAMPNGVRLQQQRDCDYQSHTFQAGKHKFTVDARYSMIRVIGSGAYGVVISAKDAKATTPGGGISRNSEDSSDEPHDNSTVAIKMVPKAFSDEIDAKRILREIKLLKHFRHDNIVSLIDMMPPNVKYLEDFVDVYMVADLMETDLHRIIYSKQKLSTDHVQYFVYQVLRGLKYIHSCKVLHRDLKPSNLLVNSNCDLKICDFGLARGVGRAESSGEDTNGTMLLTEYVVTRWYRAPEIMLACHEYSYPIDVWSVGCIFAELLLRKPMFPGEDYIDQLTIISEKLGKLPEADLDFVTSEKAKRFMRKLPNKSASHSHFSLAFPGTPLDALDVMRGMLEIHPHKRTTVDAALRHPFFEPLHNPQDEPVSSRVFDFGFERGPKLHRLKLQELIWKEVADYRPSCLPVAPSRRAGQTQQAAGKEVRADV